MFINVKREPMAAAPLPNSNQFQQAIGGTEDNPWKPETQCTALVAVPPFSRAELKSWLHYDPATGAWTWRVNRGRLACKGKPAGALNLGYRRIQIGGKLYKASRLAFYYMTGFWLPDFLVVDHISGNPSDDRWTNLRPATYRQNALNQGIGKRNKTGRIGVSPSPTPNVWKAHITVNAKTIWLGSFADIADAIAAREAAEREHFGEWARAA